MKILIAIDDTDNLESPGTGHLASILSDSFERNGWGKGGPVTRHQLYVHEDIPYTSHNSSMCFEADIDRNDLEHVTSYCQDFLVKESAPGSDPGLCIVDREALKSEEALIEYGKKAKYHVLNKDSAYKLAESLNVHLSEHGGTGDGIIGALAGTGLRLSGNDGRFKGHFKIGNEKDRMPVKEVLKRTGVDSVQTEDGVILKNDASIQLGKRIKAVLLNSKEVVLVFPVINNEAEGRIWETCTKEQLKKY
jgi:hypothetical protein